MALAERTGRERAGRYVTQTGGYRAFLPAALPPDPPVRMEGELQRLLSAADQALGRLDGSIETLPNPDLFVYMYVRKEAVLSSQIEGTQSSLQDLLAAEANLLSYGGPKDVDEVVNYVRAMNHGLERLPHLPVSVRLIREIHAQLLQGVRPRRRMNSRLAGRRGLGHEVRLRGLGSLTLVRAAPSQDLSSREVGDKSAPGELRRSQNWIGAAGSTIAEATFVPPPPEEVPGLLGQLEQFLHREPQLPLLIDIGLAHAQFETIHPFLDGNGRIGRLLITFLLCGRRVLTKPVLYLSHYFKARRTEYYERLQAVRDAGAWEEWLAFFLRGIAEVSRQATETARNILALREQHREAITRHLGGSAGNGQRVLERLFEQPMVSVNDVRAFTGLSYAAANGLVQHLVRAGILREVTGRRRQRRFQYAAYVEMFAEP